MTTVLGVAVGVLPVFLFLGALLRIDSYKVVALRAILLSVAAGVAAALASYGANVTLRPVLGLDLARYSMYVAPVVEETLKAAFVGVTGIAQGDFANLAIYVDANNDGTINGGETTTVGGTGVVSSGVTEIFFSTNFDLSSGVTVNYIVKGDVSNIDWGDKVTISLGTSNLTLVSGTVGGNAPMSVTHTRENSSLLTQIHYRWRNDDGGEGLFGSGADGSATISASKNINTSVIGSNRSTCGRHCNRGHSRRHRQRHRGEFHERVCSRR